MRTVAVTGAASGLGAVIADHLIAVDLDVVLVDRDAAALDAVAERFGGARTVVADLSEIDEVRRAADALTSMEVDGLVNNAGAWSSGTQYPRAAEAQWLSTLTLDLLAPMMLLQRLWSGLEAAVNIGSSGGEGGDPYGSPEYGAAKAGLRRLTTSLGDHDQPRVTAVVPGWIGLDRAHRQRRAMTDAQRRDAGPLVSPDDVAAAVVRLLDRGRPGEVIELV